MIYLFCLSELAAVTALFFGAARGGFRSFGTTQRLLRVLVALPLAASGIAHVTMTAAMAEMIPPVFPARPLLVLEWLIREDEPGTWLINNMRARRKLGLERMA